LVLLGDVLELRHGPMRDALGAAREPLTALGAALPAGCEVVIVPGNHDYELLDGWLARRRSAASPPALGLENEVEVREGEALAQLTSWLAPAKVRVAYPGVWLREDVYATHGQYADLHLTIPTLERIAAGVMARIVALPDGGPQSIEHYEAALAPIYAWIDAVAQRVGPGVGGTLHGSSVRGWQALRGRGLRQRAAAAGFPALVHALNLVGVGPLKADLSGAALRRAGLFGIGEVTRRLQIPARHVVFGHTHRAGPLPDDDRVEWRTAAGIQLVNSGCWIYEPAFGADGPYRAGFAVTLVDSGPPELVNLLDH
jgi:hypothetical protein